MRVAGGYGFCLAADFRFCHFHYLILHFYRGFLYRFVVEINFELANSALLFDSEAFSFDPLSSFCSVLSTLLFFGLSWLPIVVLAFLSPLL